MCIRLRTILKAINRFFRLCSFFLLLPLLMLLKQMEENRLPGQNKVRKFNSENQLNPFIHVYLHFTYLF